MNPRPVTLRSRCRWAALAWVVLGVMLLSGCGNTSQSTDKVGAARKTVLTLGNPNTDIASTPAIAFFANRVKELSKGRVQINIETHPRAATAGVEKLLLEAVTKGDYDFAYSNSQLVAPLLKTPAIESLTAPMLIDNIPLMKAVLGGDIGAEALRSSNSKDITGLALWGDVLRYPIGTAGPLTSPAGFAAHPVWAQQLSHIQTLTFDALGARTAFTSPDEVGDALSSGKLAGLVWDPKSMSNNGWAGAYFTYNEPLWPRLNLLYGNAKTLEKLSAQDRAAVTQAAHDSATFSADVPDPTTQLSTYCAQTEVTAVTASTADIAAMLMAFEPVYTELAQDADARKVIAAVADLKTRNPAQVPTAPAGCRHQGATPGGAGATPLPGSTSSSGAPADAGAARLAGTYRQVVTDEDLRGLGYTAGRTPSGAACEVSGVKFDCLAENHGTYTWVLHTDGTWSYRQRAGNPVHYPRGSGTFTVDGYRITFTNDDGTGNQGESWVNVFAVDPKGSLKLAVDPAHSSALARTNAVTPWIRID